MSNENPNRRRVDFFQAIVDNYVRIQNEIENPPAGISPERENWLVYRACVLAEQIDTKSEEFLNEWLRGTKILRSGHTAH